MGIKKGGGISAAVILCALTVALPITQFITGWSSTGSSPLVPILISSAFFAVFLLYAAGVFDLIRPKLSPVSELFMMTIYVSAAAVASVAITQSANGGLLLPVVFLCSWITDSFAYFCGSFFGKHKLIPKISPKKTVEGSVGGTVFCAIFCAIYGFIVDSITTLSVNYVALVISGLFLSIISQIGDLNASYIKRTHEIKDFGNLFPGHGGMLDRFDSVIAVVPFLYILTRFCTYFS